MLRISSKFLALILPVTVLATPAWALLSASVSAPSSVNVNAGFYVTAYGSDDTGDLVSVDLVGPNGYIGTTYSDSWDPSSLYNLSYGASQTAPSNGTTLTYTSYVDSGNYSTNGSSNVTVIAPNTPPTITWINNPSIAYVNQWFNVQARGDDADGNLSWVRVWKDDSPFAFNGGGNGSVGYSDNNAAVGYSVGTITFKAESGDSASADSGYIYHYVSVIKSGQTISFPQPAAQTYGASPVSLSASASSGLGVSYARLSGPGTVSGNSVTINGAGSIVVRASQGGDGAYDAAANVDQTLTVYKAGQTITFNQPTAQVYQGQLTLGGSASSGLTVAYAIISGPATESFGTLTFTGVGSVVVRASQGGDANYNAASSVDRTITVNKANQSISFGQPSAQTYGTPLNLSATASSSLSVSFSVVSGSATVSGTILTFTGAGSVVVRASQAGNANYNAATSVDRTITVNKANQTISFGQPALQTYGTALNLNATASSGLAVGYSVISGPASISGSTVTFSGPGNVTIRASQAGNANYNPAADVSQTFAVQKAIPAGSFSSRNFGTQTPTTYTVQAGDLNATFSGPAGAPAAPTGTVTYSVVGGATVITGTVLGVDSYLIRASYSGDANYNAATKDATWIVETDVDHDGIPGYIETLLGTDPNAASHVDDTANQNALEIQRPIK